MQYEPVEEEQLNLCETSAASASLYLARSVAQVALTPEQIKVRSTGCSATGKKKKEKRKEESILERR
jgi:hypothetical protein